MQRLLFASMAVIFTVMVLMPSVVLLRFQVRRAYVERELCVQRAIAGDMRTCHGECHLSKQLKALEREADGKFPQERFKERYEPISPVAEVAVAPIMSTVLRHFPYWRADLSKGHPQQEEGVPWA
jgi:hypothetical protein